jgi:type 1 glutamine amidotransferase
MAETIDALVIGETTFGFHSFDEMGPLLADAFAGDITVRTTTDRDDLRDLEEYDVLVDYLTDSTLTDAQHEGLFSFVRDGGGYVGVHCASDLTTTDDGGRDEPFPDFRDLLGGHFVTHPEQQDVDVEIVDREHAITAGVEDFTVFDEPYQVEVDDDVHLLARMDMEGDLAEMPVAWVKPYGEGRVFYLSLGHTEDALEHPAVGRLLSQGARWSCGHT